MDGPFVYKACLVNMLCSEAKTETYTVIEFFHARKPFCHSETQIYYFTVTKQGRDINNKIFSCKQTEVKSFSLREYFEEVST